MVVPGTSGPDDLASMWAQLEPIGARPDGGYDRFTLTGVDATLREWFVAQAQARGLDVDVDRAGNVWAWWGDPDAAVRAGRPGVVTGSHLDSVPAGGAFDGPLGVVSALAAVDLLRERGLTPDRPVGVALTTDEEGARFGVACTGSRLLTGAMAPERALGLRDRDGTSMAEALRAAGRDPAHLGADPAALARVGSFVELHVEQGRALVHRDRAVGVASAIWPHGRWRLELTGRADHAGTTPLAARDDAVLRLAYMVLAVRAAAEAHGCLATVGRVQVVPNGVNAIASAATAWLDARGRDADAVAALVADVEAATGVRAVPESTTGATPFDPALVALAVQVLGDGMPGDGMPGDGMPGQAPVLDTGAGHDAGVLAAAGVPATMLLVRNPTGVSHSPAEHAEPDDCRAGVVALADVLARLCVAAPAAGVVG